MAMAGGSLNSSDLVAVEDAMAALLDYLVAPLLPIRDLELHHPTQQQQETVAKQMHAVVMLYNYFHRRNFPNLEDLGLESICKLSCIAQPCLLAYMSNLTGFTEDAKNFNHQFSITEKMIVNACNICTRLDSSKGTPRIEAWPISKVAVFLVNPTHEKCMLQFSSVTQGVWSLVEKLLKADNKMVGKELDELAFSTVEQLTGISHSDLSILEHHLTYSLSHEKTNTLLYIMKYGQATSEELSEIAIKDVLSSLEGPIVKKASISVAEVTAEVTSVVEYYGVLAYSEIICNWISRENTSCNSFRMPERQVSGEKEHSLELEEAPPMEDHELSEISVPDEHSCDIQDCKPSKHDSSVMNKNRNYPSLVEVSPETVTGEDGKVDSQKLGADKCRPSDNEAEIIKEGRKDLFSVNGLSIDAKIHEHTRICPELIIMEDQAKSNDMTNDHEKVGANKCKLSKNEAEVLKKGKIDLFSVDGLSINAKTQEHTRICLEPNGLNIIEDRAMSDDMTGEPLEDILSCDKKKLKTDISGAVNSNQRVETNNCKPGKTETKAIYSIRNDLSSINVLSRTDGTDHRASSWKVEAHSCRPSKNDAEVINKDRKDQSSANGSSIVANIQELRTCSPRSEPNCLTIMKDQEKNDDFLNDQVEDNLRRKKQKLITDKCDVKHGETLVPDSMPAIKYRHPKKRSGSNEQLNSDDNKRLETDNPIAKKNNDLSKMNAFSCGDSKSLKVADIAHMEEQGKNDKSVQSGPTEGIIVCQNPKSGDSFINWLSVNSCKDDNPSSNHQQLVSLTEDHSGKTILSDAYINSGKNPVHNGLTFSLEGSENQAGIVDLSKKACDTVQSRATVSDDNCIATNNLQLVPLQFSPTDHNAFYHAMKSKENDLTKACLRVFHKKRDKLYQQQRLLEDEIALCEMSIQMVLTEDNLALKVESLLEALNGRSRGVQMGKKLLAQERSLCQATKRRKLSIADLSSNDACQELDEVCHRNGWTLPRYFVIPCFADCQMSGELFESRVQVEGMDFGCCSGGDPKSSPLEARKSAAANVLMKLRRIAG